jgi:hypothetical protein
MKAIKEKLNIGAGFIILGLLIWFSIQKIIEFPLLNFASPEIAGYLIFNVVIWVLTIWLGRYLYKKLKK